MFEAWWDIHQKVADGELYTIDQGTTVSGYLKCLNDSSVRAFGWRPDDTAADVVMYLCELHGARPCEVELCHCVASDYATTSRDLRKTPLTLDSADLELDTGFVVYYTVET